MGEDIGAEMALRTFGHLVCGCLSVAVSVQCIDMHHMEVVFSSVRSDLFPPMQLRYGDPVIRRAVPLALGLLSTSNPQLPILDTLSKFSHDSDPTVARNAVFSMGLVGSGTNNARLAALLRNLAQFYHKESHDLFMVRLAQVREVTGG